MLNSITNSLKQVFMPQHFTLVEIQKAYKAGNLELLNKLSAKWSQQVKEHILDINYTTNNSADVVLQMAEILSEALISSWVAHFNKNGLEAEPSIFVTHATNIVGSFNIANKMASVLPWINEGSGTNISADVTNKTNMEYIPLIIGLYTCYEKEYNKEPILKHILLEFIENYKTNMLLGEQINRKTSMFIYKDYLTGGIKPFKDLPYTDIIALTTAEELITQMTHKKYNEECISTPYFLSLLINSEDIKNQYKVLEFLNAALVNEILDRTEFMDTVNVKKMDTLSASGLMPQQSTLYLTNPNQITMETAIDQLISSFDTTISTPYNVFRSMGLNVRESIQAFQTSATITIIPEDLPDLFNEQNNDVYSNLIPEV